ncbi:MAG: methyltransferase domain-containing protein [Deltaproteobacteria bacterium]|nr:methyltransferase domain-containing protein [Deltaproteobacteria bacterium]
MSESKWNPQQYDRFRDERRQPFFDLMALVERAGNMRVVDLGCGTGELTSVLHTQLAARETIGIDSSETMLAKSASFTSAGLRFEIGDVADYRAAEPVDLLFSNAALHWVDDHPALLARLTASIAHGGQLAVQIPANHDHASHRVAAEVAQGEPFRTELRGYVRRSSVLSPERYSELLDELGYARQHVRLQVYAHYLPSRDEVVEWTKGTLLVAYQQRLSAETFARFVEHYRARLLPQLAETRPYLYPFKRILFWGRRNARM